MSYVTPKKNAAFITYVALEDQANAGLFKTSPTIAAGDCRVSIDGGALTNLATLPTNTPSGSAMVKISLSADEMNGDNITVVCKDAAGDEWYDLLVNIQTTARQVDDLSTLGGTAQTGDAYAVVAHTDYGNAKLVRSTTPANTLDIAATGEASANVTYWAGNATTSDELDAMNRLYDMIGTGLGQAYFNSMALQLVKNAIGLADANLDTQLAALPTALENADAMLDELLADHVIAGSAGKAIIDILEDTGTTLPAAIAAIEPGGGSYAGDGTGYYSDTIDDGTNPLDGVRVQLYTAQNRVGPAYEAYTNALGVFEMWPDPGTYYRWLDLAGFSFTQDVAVVVTEP